MDPEFAKHPEVKQDSAETMLADALKGKGGRSSDAMGSVRGGQGK